MKYNISNFHTGDPVEVQLRSKGYDMLMKHILLYKTELLRMYIHFDQKGGQVTKPIIVVKMPCKLLYVIQVKGFLIKCSTSWPYLISEILVAYAIVASDWPHTFYSQAVFV